MDIDKMLAELRTEREQIDEAILTLERLARGRGRRRGRPPAWLKAAQDGIAEATETEEPRKRARSKSATASAG